MSTFRTLVVCAVLVLAVQAQSKQCGVNEEFRSCGTACEPSCSKPQMDFCTLQCIIDVCQCKKGFVRNDSGVCVKSTDCPRNDTPACPAGETFNSCGACDSTCEADMMCPAVCRFPGSCGCNPGNVRNAAGKCIPKSKCPAKNNTNHLEHPCTNHTCKVGQKCVETQVQCFVAPCYPVAECVATTKYDDDQSPCFVVRCGFNTECKAINGSAQCIPRVAQDIPTQEICAVNQTFVDCPSNCPSTCSNRGQMACIKSCAPAACTCSNGYYLNDESNCVLLKDCPISNATSDSNSTELTCETVRCAHACEMISGKPKCTNFAILPPPNTTVLTCATVKCAGGSTCEIVRGKPSCISSNSTAPSNSSVLTCATVKCAGGSICEIVNGGPRCTPSNSTESPCNLIDCRTGFMCELVGEEPICVRRNATELPSECAAMLCTVGSECRRGKDGKVGCFEPLGELPSECAAISCMVGTECRRGSDGQVGCFQPNWGKDSNCSKNEVSASTGGCEPTCEEPFKVCSNSTTEACVCATGFVRKGKRCVAYSNCPTFSTTVTGNASCSNTEVYSENKNSCEETCHGNELCQIEKENTIVKGCVCRPFYKRNEKGNCVHQRFCYRSAGCGMNESWSSCVECEDKCEQRDTDCDTSCSSGCACDDGFSRNKNATCVPEASC